MYLESQRYQIFRNGGEGVLYFIFYDRESIILIFLKTDGVYNQLTALASFPRLIHHENAVFSCAAHQPRIKGVVRLSVTS
jgi:hypothetical protein